MSEPNSTFNFDDPEAVLTLDQFAERYLVPQAAAFGMDLLDFLQWRVDQFTAALHRPQRGVKR